MLYYLYFQRSRLCLDFNDAGAKSFQDEEPWIMSLAGAGILLQIE